MKNLIFLVICVFIVLFIVWPKQKAAETDTQPKVQQQPMEDSEQPLAVDDPETGIGPQSTPAPNSAQPQTQHSATTAATNSTAPPPDNDLFAKRKLDLPLPTSVNDLLTHLTTYTDPQLPDSDLGDGDVTSIYKGLYQTPEGSFQKAQLKRNVDDIEIDLENKDGSSYDFGKKSTGQMQTFNFNNDPYSLIFKMTTKKMVYLKFYTAKSIKNFKWSTRAYIGWVIWPDKIGRPVVLVDKDNYPSATDQAEETWPTLEHLQSVMPQPLK